MRCLSNYFSVLKQCKPLSIPFFFQKISVVFVSEKWSDPTAKLWAMQTTVIAPLPKDQKRRGSISLIHDPCELKWDVVKLRLDLHEQTTHWNAVFKNPD